MGTEQVGFKTILAKGATVIGNLISVAVGGVVVDFADTTHHGLTDPYHTFRATLATAGEVTFKVQMTSAQVATLYGYIDPTAAMATWTVTYPFSTPIVFTMSAQLAEFAIDDAEVDGILGVSLKLKLSGKPTLA